MLEIHLYLNLLWFSDFQSPILSVKLNSLTLYLTLSSSQDSINIGDEVVEANGTAVSNLSLDEANQALRQQTPAVLAVRSNVSAYLAARDTFYVR